ncbi:MAG: DMT family transporter [Anaerolineales bacterium]
MGEFAALATGILWAFTSLFFTLAGRRVGAAIVNRTRLLLALLFLILTHTALQGEIFPLPIEPQRFFWLSLSGIIGLALGDAALFQALVLVGPRISTLLMAAVPVLSTFLAWAFLDERLTSLELLAVGITVGGIGWVVAEKRSGPVAQEGKQYALGILAGLGGAVGQAVGLITAKKGLTGDFPPISGVVIRMTAATTVIWLWTLLKGEGRSTIQKARGGKVFPFIVAGAIVGPFLGVWLSLIAIDSTLVGLASTLMALTPIFVIPMVRIVFREKVSIRAVFGTLVAMVGVAMIFML